MSGSQRSKSSNRDSTGSLPQHRLVDLANKPTVQSSTAINANTSGMASSGSTGTNGSPSVGEIMTTARNSSFSKDASGSASQAAASDSRPSTPQSQILDSADKSPASTGGIDIPNVSGNSYHSNNTGGGGSSSSGGENHSPSLMSVINAASAPPNLSFAATSQTQEQTLPASQGDLGIKGGSSSSSDISGAGPSNGSLLGLSSPGQQVAGSSPFPVRCTSGDDGSSREDDSFRSEPSRTLLLTPESMHPSASEPIFLKPGDLSPFADFPSPGSGPREERSPKGSKKKPKSSPWYSVLASTYKSKCEEFRRLFKTIPSNERLLMDYSCALQKDILVHGRMFITEGWLCFYANIFKWETLLTIRFKDVTAITKERTIRFIPNAIQISTDSEKYFFTSFMSREKSFLLLFRIWQNALLEQTMPSNEYWSWVHSNYGTDGIGGNQGVEIPADFLEGEGLDPLEIEDSGEDVSQSLGSEDQSYDGFLPGSKVDDSQTDEMGSDGITINVPPQDKNEAGSGMEDTDDIGEAVDPLSTLDFGGKELINETFDIPVDRLFSALYDNQNPFFRNFLEYRKCTDIEIGEWSRHDSDRDNKKLTYVLHLNTSLGYKAAGVEENHILQKNWSKTGQSYIVEKEVYNKNVPYCDYFYVHTLHVLTKVSPVCTRMRVIMRTEFLKSALGLVKTFIERNVESGLKHGENELVKYLRENMESLAPPKKRKAKKRRTAHPSKKQEEKRRTDVQSQPSTQQGFLSNLTPVWFQPTSESKLSLHTTMAFISVILAVLCIFNVSLFLQLKTLEEGASKREVWSNADFVEKLGELPKTQKDWAVLLQQQQQLHSREMQKWRDIVDLCIQLIKQMETTLSELHSGSEPPDVMPSIQDLVDITNVEAQDGTVPIEQTVEA